MEKKVRINQSFVAESMTREEWTKKMYYLKGQERENFMEGTNEFKLLSDCICMHIFKINKEGLAHLLHCANPSFDPDYDLLFVTLDLISD